jgi:hypothetical protein
MRVLTALAILAALAGCASKPLQWEKPGSTQADFHQDRGQCMERVFSSTFASAYQQRGIFVSCMAGKGWQAVEIN